MCSRILRQGVALTRRCAELEHALAVLAGSAPSQLTLPRQPLAFRPLAIPAGLPSQLLERRPDIAAAERAMAAANARIGIARAAWFPRLTLTGLLGLESADLGDLARCAKSKMDCRACASSPARPTSRPPRSPPRSAPPTCPAPATAPATSTTWK